MEYISTTNLRTQSKQLINSLKQGKMISLLHRSKIVAKIIPENSEKIKTIDAHSLNEKINKLGLPPLTLKEIDRRYRAAMMRKHGKGIR